MSRFSSLTTRIPVLALLCWGLTLPASLCAASKELQQTTDKGVAFLKSNQDKDGTWTDARAIGVSALVLHALLQNGVPADDPVVAKGLSALLANVQPDGGIYHEKSLHKNYETCIAIMALISANRGQQDRQTIDRAVAFVKKLQWDEEEVGDASHLSYGGSGYGSHQRPDLSNTTFFLEALRSAGVPASDPAVQKALAFVSRCQNLPSEHNQTEFAEKVKDGGFYYSPAAGGSSQAGTDENGGLRSYASMTYAGLKSMIYAGLTPDDFRVKAAQEWLRKHYTLEENPGMGQQGLFYYYQTFGKTLDTLGMKRFEDADGKFHDWRADLARQLISTQQPDGSWLNANPRWYEGDPNLSTAYSLIALSYCDE